MMQVSFNSKGYDCVDDGKYVLFSEDAKRNFLLNYVAKDLSPLSGMLEKYVSKGLNISTFELTGYVYDESDYAEIKELLTPIHPYYTHEFRDVLIKAIGDYFNDLRVYASYLNDTLDYVYDREWYTHRFKAITAPLLLATDSYLEDFYNTYEDKVAGKGHKSFDENFSFGTVNRPAQGFRTELTAQKCIKRMLFWILDISAPNICDLTISQRAQLYGKLYENGEDNRMVATKFLSFNHFPVLFRGDLDRTEEVEHLHKLEDIFDPLRKTDFYTAYDSNLPKNLDALNRAIEYVKTAPAEVAHENYRVNNLHQLLYLEILSMIQNSTKIKECKNCRAYFVVVTRKKEYCDRVAEGETKPCSEIGRSRSYAKAVKSDPLRNMYNQAYRLRYARHDRGSLTQSDFNDWCIEAKEKLDKVSDKELDKSEFEAWLKQ